MKIQYILFALILHFLTLSAHASETTKGVRKDFDNFKAEMSEKLDAAEKKLIQLRAKTKEKSTAVKDDMVNELELTRDQLKTKLNKADDATKDGWQKFKKSFSEAVDNLNTKIQKSLKD